MDNPFLIFCGYSYYASPGWEGFIGRSDSLENAIAKGKAYEIDILDGCGWWQVVDIRTDEIVAGEGRSHTGLCGESQAFAG